MVLQAHELHLANQLAQVALRLAVQLCQGRLRERPLAGLLVTGDGRDSQDLSAEQRERGCSVRVPML